MNAFMLKPQSIQWQNPETSGPGVVLHRAARLAAAHAEVHFQLKTTANLL